MLDTHAIARSLTNAGIQPEHADAITDAVRQAAEAPAEMATKADLADLRADLYRALWLQAGAIIAAVAGIVGVAVAVVRMLLGEVNPSMTNAAIVPPPGAQLAAAASARRLADTSMSANTRRVYLGALARLDGRALDDASLAAYLAVLHDAGRAPASASTAVAGARFRARLAGLDDPAGEATARVLVGFRRTAAERGRGQVAGVRWEQADAAVRA